MRQLVVGFTAGVSEGRTGAFGCGGCEGAGVGEGENNKGRVSIRVVKTTNATNLGGRRIRSDAIAGAAF